MTAFIFSPQQQNLISSDPLWGQFLSGPLPYILVYKSRNLSQNKILHTQFVLYMGNTLREEIIPKAS